MLLKRLGLYVAAVHVPSNARVLFGVMAQAVHPGPSHGEAGRYTGFSPVTLSPKVSSIVLLISAARVVDEAKRIVVVSK